MFTEKEIAIAINAYQYGGLLKAYQELSVFKAHGAKITYNTIRLQNGFEANEEFEKLIDGTDPATKPDVSEYREKRRYIRQNNAGRTEAELNKLYPDLGFGDE